MVVNRSPPEVIYDEPGILTNEAIYDQPYEARYVWAIGNDHTTINYVSDHQFVS